MSTKKKILFVDDDARILDGLKRALRNERRQWDMSFVLSSEQGLELMAQDSFDALVTDMRMPGINGVQLLSEVSRLYPNMVRFILSGYSNEDMTMSSVKLAHQFFTKPCDIKLLKDALTRALSLRELLDDSRLQSLVSGTVALPSLPDIYVEIVEKINSPNVSVKAVGNSIAKDPAITAKTLQLVNSAFFGFGRHISTPGEAATLLGLDTIKHLVLSVGLFSQFGKNSAKLSGLSLRELADHSIRVGLLAKRIAESEQVDVDMLDECYLSGFMHDIGKLVLAYNMPKEYGQVHALAQGGTNFYRAEMEVLGTHHGAVGAYLLGLWGFSDAVMETVAFHHKPELSQGTVFAPLTAVHVADALDSSYPGQDNRHISMEYLSGLGLEHRVATWESIYADVDLSQEQAV